MVHIDKKNHNKNRDVTKKVGTGLYKCLKVPFKVLAMARDFYVRSITDCSGRVRYGPPLSQLQGLPKSLSSSSSKSTIIYNDEDLRELIRAASTRTLRDNIKLEIPEGHCGYYKNNRSSKMIMDRSLASGIGRIDEEMPCEFGEDVWVEPKINTIYPRSRSDVVMRRGG